MSIRVFSLILPSLGSIASGLTGGGGGSGREKKRPSLLRREHYKEDLSDSIEAVSLKDLCQL